MDLENETIHDTPLKNKVAMDIGAHIGNYTLEMAKVAEIVIAVEPHPDNIRNFKERVLVTNVLLRQGVVGSGGGKRKLYTNSNPGGHSMAQSVIGPRTWGHDPDRFIEVDCWTLDELAGNLDIGLIKIDVEGAEEEVLRSGEKTLRRCHPVIVLESHQTINGKALTEYLLGLGYRVLDEDGANAEIVADKHYRIIP